jgi:hypothetical protein
MKKCSISLVIKEMQIKITDFISLQLEWPKSRVITITIFYTACGNAT